MMSLPKLRRILDWLKGLIAEADAIHDQAAPGEMTVTVATTGPVFLDEFFAGLKLNLHQ